MKERTIRDVLTAAMAGAVAFGLIGCGGGPGRAPAEPIDAIAGTWTATYYQEVAGVTVPVGLTLTLEDAEPDDLGSLAFDPADPAEPATVVAGTVEVTDTTIGMTRVNSVSVGGTPLSDNVLDAWMRDSVFELEELTYELSDSNLLLSAPDGSPGTVVFTRAS